MSGQNSSPSRAEVIAAMAEYKATLHAFRIKRNPGLYDDATIFRAMVQFGAEMVLLALRGARFEPRREGFDPSTYCSLTRILGAENIERFANLGARQDSATEPPIDSTKDRAKIAVALKRIKGAE